MDGIPHPTGDSVSVAAAVQNWSEASQSKGNNVNPHNTNQQPDEQGQPVRIVATRENVRVIGSGVTGPAALVLADDDTGRDPYNSTGQHVIIKMKLAPQD